MTFSDPGRLWLLLLVAAVAIAYVAVQRRRGTYAMRFSDTSLIDAVAPKRPGWRRHIVAVLFLATGATLVGAVAGPVVEDEVPRERATVVLAIDTSLSMGAEDVDPTRIDGAKQAALAFLDDAPPTVEIGLVSFDGTAQVDVVPTDDRSAVGTAVENLELDEATATGDAIFAGLDALESAGVELAPADPTEGDADENRAAAVIVLLSDGTPTVPPPEIAARFWVDEAIAAALDSNVQVSTVAFGTAVGFVEIEDPAFPGVTSPVPVPVDEDILDTIATDTGGTFFATASADELADVYRDIGTTVGFDTVARDVTDWFIVAALALAAATSVLSLLWFQRLP